MRPMLLGLALLGATALPALAQTTPAPATAPATRTAPPRDAADSNAAVRNDAGPRTADAPAPGANSFTEGQARGRIEAAGYSGVAGLEKDDQGIWRGRAMRNGAQASVALDYQGNVTAR